MRHTLITIALCLVASVAWAQKSLMIQHVNGNTDYALVSTIDEITFSEDLSKVVIVSGSHSVEIDRDDVAAMDYVVAPESFSVNYSDSTATVVNPYFLQGVSVSVNGANVVVTNENTETELTFSLTGETDNGSFTYNASHKSTIVLDSVSITNPNGPAIDLQCGKRVALELKKGTVNTLVDGTGGDWKAALYCKGHLEIDKAGTLNVTGNTKHAISAKEYIQLKKSSGVINVLGAKGDGIHCQQYFLAGGFEVNIKNVEGDGIQAELSGDEGYEEDYPDGSMWIKAGTFNIFCASEDTKCLKADESMNLVGGNITLSHTGKAGKCVKCDGAFNMGDKETGLGPVLTASTTGGVSASASAPEMEEEMPPFGEGMLPFDEDMPPFGGEARARAGFRPGGDRPGNNPWDRPGGDENNGESSAKAIKALGAINLYGGESTVTTLSNGAEGIESKVSVTIAGGRHYVKAYDDAINSSGPIVFDGGMTVCCSTGNDAVDSNYGRTGAIVIGNGAVLTYTTRGGAEMGFDCDGNSFIQIKGNGIAISAGGNQGGSSSATLSNAAQGYAFLTSSISYQSGRYYTLADSNGNALVTYCFEGNVNSSCSMFTATGMTKGSTYTVKYGTSAPTDATDSFHGFYIGGTANATNSVTSFTAK